MYILTPIHLAVQNFPYYEDMFNPSQYKGPNLAQKMSVGPVLALCGVLMNLFTIFCPVSEQTNNRFIIKIKLNI